MDILQDKLFKPATIGTFVGFRGGIHSFDDSLDHGRAVETAELPDDLCWAGEVTEFAAPVPVRRLGPVGDTANSVR